LVPPTGTFTSLLRATRVERKTRDQTARMTSVEPAPVRAAELVVLGKPVRWGLGTRATEEPGGIVRHCAELLCSSCTATAPRTRAVLRKTCGGACAVTDTRPAGTGLSFARPADKTVVMGAEGAAGVVPCRGPASSPYPAALRSRSVEERATEPMPLCHAAERGRVDGVIDSAGTYRMPTGSLAMLTVKRTESPVRRHGNPPSWPNRPRKGRPQEG